MCNSTLIICVKRKARVNLAQPPCGYSTVYKGIFEAEIQRSVYLALCHLSKVRGADVLAAVPVQK